MRAAALVLALLAGAAHAQAEPRLAAEGVAADAASTWISLGAGATELNPLGYYTVPLRVGIVMYARKLPEEQGVPITQGVTAASWGAAANNLAAALGIGSGALALGAVVGLVLWNRGADERDFWRQCAEFKAGHPERSCRYTKG